MKFLWYVLPEKCPRPTPDLHCKTLVLDELHVINALVLTKPIKPQMVANPEVTAIESARITSELSLGRDRQSEEADHAAVKFRETGR
jgi:hypothetical protein